MVSPEFLPEFFGVRMVSPEFLLVSPEFLRPEFLRGVLKRISMS